MTEMGIDAIYPKMNLSKTYATGKSLPVSAAKCHYRPSKSGMVNRHYLYPYQARIPLSDSHNRLVQPLYRRLEVDDTLDTRMVINALKKAFKVAKPVILNSDQGCQFTSNEYMSFLKDNHIRQR